MSKDKTGIELIAEERQEQIHKHGFSITKDADYYHKQELLQAALFCIDYVSLFENRLRTHIKMA